jgi:hypothetical protein
VEVSGMNPKIIGDLIRVVLTLDVGMSSTLISKDESSLMPEKVK